jgi:hypothetical protein
MLFSIFAQTLTALYLNNNRISGIGAEHLAFVLRNNRVTNSSLHIYLIFSSHFIQTLTTLSLGENIIGHTGIKYLADALRNNKVTVILPVLSRNSEKKIRKKKSGEKNPEEKKIRKKKSGKDKIGKILQKDSTV